MDGCAGIVIKGRRRHELSSHPCYERTGWGSLSRWVKKEKCGPARHQAMYGAPPPALTDSRLSRCSRSSHVVINLQLEKHWTSAGLTGSAFPDKDARHLCMRIRRKEI